MVKCGHWWRRNWYRGLCVQCYDAYWRWCAKMVGQSYHEAVKGFLGRATEFKGPV